MSQETYNYEYLTKDNIYICWEDGVLETRHYKVVGPIEAVRMSQDEAIEFINRIRAFDRLEDTYVSPLLYAHRFLEREKIEVVQNLVTKSQGLVSKERKDFEADKSKNFMF
jgi:hypothetical protein